MSVDVSRPVRAGVPAFGVDIGGTTIIAVALAADGAVIERARTATPVTAGAGAVLDAAAALLWAVGFRAGAGVGVGSAGVIDADGCVSAATSAIPGWQGTDIRSGLGARLGVEPVVCNDVHAFLLGEASHGAAAGAPSAIGVTVGTGIGGAMLLDGHLVTGSRDAAGHVGHIPTSSAVGKPCPCGRLGHLEALAGGAAMLEAFNAGAAVPAAGVAEVAERALGGDVVAAGILGTAGAAVGTVLSGLINAIDPAVVVLGGGIVKAGPPFVGPLREAVAESVLPVLADTPIREAALGDEAAAIGAARRVAAAALETD